MGKGIANYGLKSGILPTTRSILKKPTIKQTTLVEKASAPKITGIDGVGYAEGVQHPRNSRRVQPDMKFIDVEELIKKSVAAPSSIKNTSTPEQVVKAQKSELRRQYLAAAFRKEEQKLLFQEELLKKKEALLEEEKINHLKEVVKVKSSDLTIPSLERMLEEPMMRQRTKEETELLQMKRKHNRELLEFKARERKLANLIELYHVSNEFIITEEQLTKKIDEVFIHEGSELLRTKLGMSVARIRSRNENSIGDALFGSIGGGSHIGLPVIKDYLSGEMNEFAEQIETKSNEVLEQQKNDLETIL